MTAQLLAVPTVSDEFGDGYDDVDHAARLVSMAQDVLVRAVMYVREGAQMGRHAEALNFPEHDGDQYTGRDRPVGRRARPAVGDAPGPT